MGLMYLRGRSAVRLMAIVLVVAAAAIAVPYAQSRYPARVVMLTTHSSPGGGSDVFLREMAPHLSRVMGIKVVVNNLAGGSGARAMAVLAGAEPDGSRLYATTPTFVYTSLLSSPAARYTDLEPLVNIFFDPEVLYTAANSPAAGHRPCAWRPGPVGRREPGLPGAAGDGAAEAASAGRAGGRHV